MKTNKMLRLIFASTILAFGVVGVSHNEKTLFAADEEKDYADSFTKVPTKAYTKNGSVSTGDLTWLASSYQVNNKEFYLGANKNNKDNGKLGSDTNWTNEIAAYKATVNSSFDASSNTIYFVKTTTPTSFVGVDSIKFDWSNSNGAGKLAILVATSSGYLTTTGNYASADHPGSEAGSLSLSLNNLNITGICFAFAPTSAYSTIRLTNIAVVAKPQQTTTSYSITVTNGTSSEASVESGKAVTLTPTVPEGKIFDYWTIDGDETKYYDMYYKPTITKDVSFTAHFIDIAGSNFAYLDFRNKETTDSSSGAANLNSYISSSYIASIISDDNKKVYPNSSGGLKLSNSSVSGQFTINLAEGYTATGLEITDKTFAADAGKHKLTVNGKSGDFYSAEVAETQSYSFTASNTITVAATKRGYVYTIKITGITKTTVNCSVTFKDGENTLSTSEVEKNSKVTQPTNPEKEGYTFAGWYSEDTLQNAYDFNSEVSTDISLYAKWNINTYDVYFDEDKSTVDWGTVLTKPADPEKEGYTFAGWYVGETPYDFTAPVKSELEIKSKWNINTYDVYFDEDKSTVDWGTVLTKPADPEKEGYTFTGWYVGETPYDFTAPVKSELEIKSKWNVIMCSIQIEDNEPFNVEYGSKVTKPADPEKEGFTFVGWYIGETPYDFDTIVKTDLQITAKWDEIQSSEEQSEEPSEEPSSEPVSEPSEKTSSEEISSVTSEELSSEQSLPSEEPLPSGRGDDSFGCECAFGSSLLSLLAILGLLVSKRRR